LMAGPGVPGHLLLLSQNTALSKAYGSMKEEDIEKSNKINKQIYNIVMNAENTDSMKAQMSVLYKNTIMKDPNFKLPNDISEDSLIRKETNKLDNPWIKFFLSYDPASDLMKVKCPVLAINGEKDVQVVPIQNLNDIEYALSRAKNEKLTLKKYPNLNHLFQECKYGVPQEYGDLEQTIAPVVLQDILKWVKEQVQ
jgi:uncharacterized protein